MFNFGIKNVKDFGEYLADEFENHVYLVDFSDYQALVFEDCREDEGEDPAVFTNFILVEKKEGEYDYNS